MPREYFVDGIREGEDPQNGPLTIRIEAVVQVGLRRQAGGRELAGRVGPKERRGVLEHFQQHGLLENIASVSCLNQEKDAVDMGRQVAVDLGLQVVHGSAWVI